MVLGGAGLVMFGMVAATGIRILANVDFKTNRFNAMIVAVSIGVGMIPLVAPNFKQWMPHDLHPLIESGILLSSLAAVLLNLSSTAHAETTARPLRQPNRQIHTSSTAFAAPPTPRTHEDPLPVMATLQHINQFSPADFSAAFGAVYEHSPWIAERAFALKPAAGFASRAAVHAALVATVQSAAADEKLGLLNAHPELAGKRRRQAR